MKSEESQATPNDQTLKVRLVQVAVELLAEPRGMKLPTMREIASKAGVAPGAAYRHFDSQEELFFAVVSELFGQLEFALVSSARDETDPVSIIRKFAHAYVNWGSLNKGGYQLLFETTDDDDLMATGKRPGLHLIDHMATILSGNPKPTKEELAKATQIWASLHGIVSLRTHKTGMPWPTSVETDVDQLIDTLLKTYNQPSQK